MPQIESADRRWSHIIKFTTSVMWTTWCAIFSLLPSTQTPVDYSDSVSVHWNTMTPRYLVIFLGYAVVLVLRSVVAEECSQDISNENCSLTTHNNGEIWNYLRRVYYMIGSCQHETKQQRSFICKARSKTNC